MKDKEPSAKEYITDLNINGLNGRILYLPASDNKRNREILFVYGHHSTIERWWGFIQDLSQYGNVTVPDLPGFGGMDSFYKINLRPSIDNLADYLASVVKLRYRKNRKVSIAGLSFGFVVVTRMLQKYPELTSKIDLLVSVVGFSHHDDFRLQNNEKRRYARLFSLLTHYPIALVFRYTALLRPVISLVYAKTPNAKHKFAKTKPEEFKAQMNMEVKLWQLNDVRTHWFTTVEMLKLNNCKKPVKTKLHHVYVRGEKYFDNNRVEQHLKVIFEKVEVYESSLDNHAPSIIATMSESRPLIPDAIREVLRS